MATANGSDDTKIKSSGWNYRLAGIAGGLLLAAGHFYSPLAILQIIAFLPMMIVLLRNNGGKADAAVAGLYLSLAYILPQMAYLRMPVIITLILLVYMVAMLILLSVFIGALIRKPAISSSLLIGIAMYAIDYLNCTLLPVWGLAQSFVRPWSAYPLAIGFISITGICGVIFVIGSLQALAAHYLTDKSNRKVIICTALLILLACAGADYLTLPATSETLKGATIGWVLDEANDQSNPSTDEGFEKLFLEPARKAVAEGARIITTGELGFYLNNHIRKEIMDKFTSFAKENNVWLSIGVFDLSANKNKVLFISPAGEIAEDYTKTYLTPLEPGKKGPGHLKSIIIDGFDIGTMICQDDNFPQQTTIYGRNGTGLVICPTADWTTIRRAHLQAVRARAIECRYSIVRAAANGISAIIAPTGELLAEMDHYTQGPGYLIADVPICTDRTLFSKHGFALPLAIGSLIAIMILSKKGCHIRQP